MATRKDVATLAGVSESTVSRVFSNRGLVNRETQDKVLKAATSLGYTPNALAQSVARRKSMNIGVVIPYIPNVHMLSTYYFSEILSGAGETARSHGYDLVLFYRDALQKEVDYRHYYLNKKIDGCLLLGTRMDEREHLRLLREEGYPFVLLSNSISAEKDASVDADYVDGSYEAMKHLVEQGHQTIAFFERTR